VFCLIYIFCFPYFDHDAFMHHVFHVLDAPGHEYDPPPLVNVHMSSTWNTHHSLETAIWYSTMA